MKKTTLFFVFAIFGFISCSTTPVLIKIEPSSHNFGQVNIGASETFDFIISNNKSVDITLVTVTFQTGEFAEITNAQGKIIVAKANLLITVSFTPVTPGGLKSDKMSIEWTDVNGKTGKIDVSLEGEAVAVSIIDASTSFDFGTVGIGNVATHNFNIENTGTADLILSLFNFNGNSTLFSITAGGTVPITVIPGSTHAVTVQFAPTASGSFPTVFEISHNAVNIGTPFEINISAAGGGGRIELNQASPWDFGEVNTGSSTTDVLEISNTGSINLNINNITLTTGVEFTVDKIEDSAGNPLATPFAIAPSDFVEVTIKFEPQANQNYDDTLSIENDGSYAVSPATINLIGEGRAPITQTFNFTGSVQQYNVAAGVTSISTVAKGAQGGQGASSVGGKGGQASATIPVNPGESLNVYVGGEGTREITATTGGYNGGGGVNGNGYAGTGGGASDIRRGTDLNNRLLVGAGGGGGGYQTRRGGYGGGLNGQDAPDISPNWPNSAGKGATQTAGGAAGYYTGFSADPGTFGLGGRGRGDGAGGGGGGGGWYGGGGGCFTGAGGGSSYYDTSGNTNKSTTPDVQTGNGQIVINY